MNFPNASNAFKKLNPHIFGGQPVARLPDTKRQHVPVQALVKGAEAERTGKDGMVQVVVKIISIRRREIDGDNLQAGAKPLRDAIARSLGIDDGSKRLRFEYDSVVTKGQPGTQVLISMGQLNSLPPLE